MAIIHWLSVRRVRQGQFDDVAWGSLSTWGLVVNICDWKVIKARRPTFPCIKVCLTTRTLLFTTSKHNCQAG